MMREIERYERIGNSYIAYNSAGRPIGIITEVKSVNTPSRRVKRSYELPERLAR